jgi:hypothetical protein
MGLVTRCLALVMENSSQSPPSGRDIDIKKTQFHWNRVFPIVN